MTGPGIVMRTYQDKFIGKVEDFLKNQINLAALDLPCAALSSRGEPLHFSISSKNLLVYERLRVLSMDTWWGMLPGGIMFPKFINTDSNIRTRIEWQPPDDMALMLLSWYEWNRQIYNFHYALLVAVDQSGKRYRLPFSNLYPDARICLGDHADLNTGNFGLSMDRLHTALVTNPWYKDLLEGGDLASNFMRFTPAGKQLPVGEETHWTKCSTIVSIEAVNRMSQGAIWK